MLEQLTVELIQRYLDAEETDYSIDDDGAFQIEYEREEQCGCELTAWLRVEDGPTYGIHVASEKMFPNFDSSRLVEMCNTWNSTELYPTAYVLFDEDNPMEVDVLLDHYVYFPNGVTVEQLGAITDEIIDNAFDFWYRAHQEHGL